MKSHDKEADVLMIGGYDGRWVKMLVGAEDVSSGLHQLSLTERLF
jgi:hypothetical protein